MNIVIKTLKKIVSNINKKVNPILEEVPIHTTGMITFDFNNSLTIISTLDDKQLESLIILLINDVGVECILLALQNINPEQFIRVTDSIKAKNDQLAQAQELESDDDSPIAQVVFQNE